MPPQRSPTGRTPLVFEPAPKGQIAAGGAPGRWQETPHRQTGGLLEVVHRARVVEMPSEVHPGTIAVGMIHQRIRSIGGLITGFKNGLCPELIFGKFHLGERELLPQRYDAAPS